MKDRIYIISDRNGVRKMTKNAPSLFQGEIAVALSIEIPQEVYREPTISASLTVPAEAVIQPSIDVHAETVSVINQELPT